MRSYKRLQVPLGKETPDAKGFFEYAKQHYRRCMSLAAKIAMASDEKPLRSYVGSSHLR